jgi:hypothetical protein
MRLCNQPEYRRPTLAIDGVTCTKKGIGFLGGEDVRVIAMNADKRSGLSHKIRSVLAIFDNRSVAHMHPKRPRASESASNHMSVL